MTDLQTLLDKAIRFATDRIGQYPERILYHDLRFATRLQKNIDKIVERMNYDEPTRLQTKIAGWLVAASFKDYKIEFNDDGSFVSNISTEATATAKVFFAEYPIEEKLLQPIAQTLGEVGTFEMDHEMTKVLSDALFMDILAKKGTKNMRKLYDQMLLSDVNLSKKKWYDLAIGMVQGFQFQLPYCQEEIQPNLDALLVDLEKNKKKLEKTADLALKKELAITDNELKVLKKNLKNSKGRDDRGIQTVFRTTSKNHYTMSEMVDRKASIMITVNSIILSLVIGGLIGEVNSHGHFHFTMKNAPIILLTLTSALSILFAVLSIRPTVTHGEFTEEEVRNKQGNLLFYGNFHNMQMRDYEWAFLQMMNDQDYLYSSLVKDIYYMGQQLKVKYKHIRISLTTFMVGMTLAVFVLLVSSAFAHC